jgi:hypothetical protein
MFLTTKAGGMTQAFPNVCKVPAPPAPPIPTPFPSIGQCANADASTCTTKVRVQNKAVLTIASEIPMTQGDEPGTLGGLVSGTRGDVCKRAMGSPFVEIEGDAAVADTMPITSNGANANAPTGFQVAPSQTKVLLTKG